MGAWVLINDRWYQACCACPAGQRISFNFKVIPSLNKVLTMQLARGEFIDRRANIIALGPGGTGKTHIALGLGLAACQKGRKVRFTTAAALVCAFRGIRPPIPTASGHLNRSIRPPVARCVEA